MESLKIHADGTIEKLPDVPDVRYRPDFDYRAECGIWACLDCGKPFYPMELDNEEKPDICPECLGQCVKIGQ